MINNIDKETILKFDKPGPRYTSYPTAPNWSMEVNEEVYKQNLKIFGQTDKTLSLYIHIPFCQTLCTYCACNVLIRKYEDKYGDMYLNHLFKEMELIAGYIGSKKTIKQFHWGGGTPTFLTEEQIEKLFVKAQEYFDIDPQGEIAIEIDPRTIDKSKMRKLKSLGFNRISMGVQDFNEDVQKAVNRIQPYELVHEYTEYCRELKFKSVNFDLIYGLPHQTTETFSDSVKKVLDLRPDRIALYSFAYVPWLKKHQQKISENDLPDNNLKLDIFIKASQQLTRSGYEAIAMDHFALKNDELARAFHQGKLYRNFMGYTVKPADEYIGIGLTSIGCLENTFVQNHKVLKDYTDALENNQLPIERGKVLDKDDLIRRWTINTLMCQFRLDKQSFYKLFNNEFDNYFKGEKGHIINCVKDNLIIEDNDSLKVTDLGKLFIRNVCMGFDGYLQKSLEQRFSQTV